ncbi:MAG: nuclear transport factor 2 family protein [Candidatus Eisenbacteria bacterium]|uniref:Nuclear transport factor 2 family protein n=1 Tax=Eiseniibacteriota bacterium TaxID=2212470 RepID=A0A948S0N8_UNCEI|nr:nuclear transport factor 2 family protein [Candidatus Eisenbacteria bacterium]MBU1950318.1 nuclear transport factor 2 family protein [Candidatus Eisenbacteria bacterium]MBU2693178.1 nuclear transport factor 2 family protein [Candidatus Eisenbacteria bacterium]
MGLVCMALLMPSLVLSEESVEAAIRARVKQYETAYNAGDVEALAKIYTIDATGFGDRGGSLTGLTWVSCSIARNEAQNFVSRSMMK